MATILPGRLLVPQQTKKRFVDQRRGLQRMAKPYVPHFRQSQSSMLLVHQRQQLFRPRIPGFNRIQNSSHVNGFGSSHLCSSAGQPVENVGEIMAITSAQAIWEFLQRH